LLANADMGPAEERVYRPLDDAGRALLRAAMQQLAVSGSSAASCRKLQRRDSQARDWCVRQIVVCLQV
jgi:hypothetical protein